MLKVKSRLHELSQRIALHDSHLVFSVVLLDLRLAKFVTITTDLLTPPAAERAFIILLVLPYPRPPPRHPLSRIGGHSSEPCETLIHAIHAQYLAISS